MLRIKNRTNNAKNCGYLNFSSNIETEMDFYVSLNISYKIKSISIKIKTNK